METQREAQRWWIELHRETGEDRTTWRVSWFFDIYLSWCVRADKLVINFLSLCGQFRRFGCAVVLASQVEGNVLLTELWDKESSEHAQSIWRKEEESTGEHLAVIWKHLDWLKSVVRRIVLTLAGQQLLKRLFPLLRLINIKPAAKEKYHQEKFWKSQLTTEVEESGSYRDSGCLSYLFFDCPVTLWSVFCSKFPNNAFSSFALRK